MPSARTENPAAASFLPTTPSSRSEITVGTHASESIAERSLASIAWLPPVGRPVMM